MLYIKQTTGKGNIARHTLVQTKGNTGVNTREKSSRKPPAGHWHSGGGGMRKRKIPEMESDTTHRPARGGRV